KVGNNFFAHAAGRTGNDSNLRVLYFSHNVQPNDEKTKAAIEQISTAAFSMFKELIQSVQRLLKISEQILDVFNTDGDTHQIRWWHQLRAFSRDVRHLLWVLNQRFQTAQRFSQTHQAGIHACLTGVVFRMEAHLHHAAESTHLLRSNIVARVIRQTWVENLLDLWTRLQVSRYLLRIAAVTVHAHCQGLDTAGGEVGIERRR